MSKIFGHSPEAARDTPVTSAPAVHPATPVPTAPDMGTPSPAPSIPAQPVGAPKSVDVAAILSDLAAKNPEKLDWKKSIVDLLKLVGMDSSLAARKELAADLNYSGDTSDSATMNIWLHQEVLKKLAANGGKIPAELLD